MADMKGILPFFVVEYTIFSSLISVHCGAPGKEKLSRCLILIILNLRTLLLIGGRFQVPMNHVGLNTAYSIPGVESRCSCTSPIIGPPFSRVVALRSTNLFTPLEEANSTNLIIAGPMSKVPVPASQILEMGFKPSWEALIHAFSYVFSSHQSKMTCLKGLSGEVDGDATKNGILAAWRREAMGVAVLPRPPRTRTVGFCAVSGMIVGRSTFGGDS
jgi:hypothetical protein